MIPEGKQDVQQAAQTGQSYLDQAKTAAGSVAAVAQGYVEAGQNRLQQNGVPVNEVTGTLSKTAGVVLDATKSALNYAQETLKPTVQATAQKASEVAAPYVQSAKETVQPHVDNAVGTAKTYVQGADESVAKDEKPEKPKL